jgi:PGF-pre-PGF domain-containing protein
VTSGANESDSADGNTTDGLRIDIQAAAREEPSDDQTTVVGAQQVNVQNAPGNSSLSFSFARERETTTNSSDAGTGPANSTTGSENIVMDRLDMGVERGGNFDLRVESREVTLRREGGNQSTTDTESVDFSVESLSKTGQTFVRTTGSRPTGYIEVNHSVPDAEIGSVTHHFRVRKSYLDRTGVGPEAVSLYRKHGDWNTLETRRVGETVEFYHYEAVSPGLSLFTIGARTPSFEIQRAQVSSQNITVGEAVAVNVTVANVGRANGTYTARLVADGRVVATRNVSLAATASRTVQLRHTFGTPGNYSLAVGTVDLQQVEVQQPQQTTTGQSAAGSPVWLVGAFVALTVILLGLVAWRRRRDGDSDPLD